MIRCNGIREEILPPEGAEGKLKKNQFLCGNGVGNLSSSETNNLSGEKSPTGGDVGLSFVKKCPSSSAENSPRGESSSKEESSPGKRRSRIFTLGGKTSRTCSQESLNRSRDNSPVSPTTGILKSASANQLRATSNCADSSAQDPPGVMKESGVVMRSASPTARFPRNLSYPCITEEDGSAPPGGAVNGDDSDTDSVTMATTPGSPTTPGTPTSPTTPRVTPGTPPVPAAMLRKHRVGLHRSHTWTACDAPDRGFGGYGYAGAGGGRKTDSLRQGLLTRRHKHSISLQNVFCMVKETSINSVKTLIKLFEMNVMSEGRKTQVMLLDDRRLEILIQPKLYAGELLDLVASHFNLKEKEYFGLSFKDDTGHHHWLQLDRKVLEHEFPKKSGPLVLFFAVRFFIESIAYLQQNATVELFYLQAKYSIYKGLIEADSETLFELAAHALQVQHGDFSDDDLSKKQLKKLPVLPTSALKEHPSISYCEDRVVEYYKKLNGQTRGSAIVNYMNICESLPTYGIHYYEVKDKAGIPWWLGLSYKGISQYDFNDKRTPRRNFAWKQLENLYFRDKKFSIEVHDPKRVSVSRRTFGPGNVNVHAWFTSSPSLTKCIWSMAVSQHQFYLDRKQSKAQLPTVRSMSEIAADLCHSTSSLPSSASGEISRSNSAHSLTISLSTSNSNQHLSQEEIEACRAAQRDMLEALKARKAALEDALKKRTEQLKALCLKEAELTGQLPPETPLQPGEPIPQVRRRVGTSFTLSPKIINRDRHSEEEELLAKLELELEIQDKICKAATKLIKDNSVNKTARKQRRQSYHRAHQKLKEIEKKLNDARRHLGKTPVKVHQSIEDSDFISPVNSPAIQRHGNLMRHHGNQGQVKIITSPKVEVVELDHSVTSPSMRRVESQGYHGNIPPSPTRQPHLTRSSTSSPSLPHRGVGSGYTPNSVYTTRTQYRSQMYPTFSQQRPNQGGPDYDNIQQQHSNRNIPLSQEVLHNMYNIQNLSTCRYDSGDELRSNSSVTDDEYEDHHHQGQHPPVHPAHRFTTKHGSLDRRRHDSGEQHEGGYRSLERNKSAPIILPELQPSKYGSKRESTAESFHPHPAGHPGAGGHHHHPHPAGPGGHPGPGQDGYHPDSRVHMVEMPQEGGIVFQGYIGGGESDPDLPPPPPPITHQYHEGGGYPPPPPDGTYHREPGDGSGGHGYPPNSAEQWYESGIKSGADPAVGPAQGGGGVRQANPPRTPVYEQPPMSFVQQDPPPAQQTYAHTEQQQMTVTKFQSYVEVSKPFEMSDFYKYSEKLRKQRTVEKRQQRLEAVLAGQAIPSPQGTPGPRGQADGSVYSSGTPSPVGAGAARYHGYPLASPSSPGSMSPGGGSTYSSGSAAAQGQGQQGSPALVHRGSRSSSPYTDGSGYHAPSSPNPGASYPTRGVRGPAAASYGIHSSSNTSSATYSATSQHSSSSSYHAHHQVAYQSTSSSAMVAPPTKQIVYQPPAPQTCTPLTPNSSSNTTPNRSLDGSVYGRLTPGMANLSFSSYGAGGGVSPGGYPGGGGVSPGGYPGGQGPSPGGFPGGQGPSPGKQDLAGAFSQEMLAWYEDQDHTSSSSQQQPHPSTLV